LPHRVFLRRGCATLLLLGPPRARTSVPTCIASPPSTCRCHYLPLRSWFFLSLLVAPLRTTWETTPPERGDRVRPVPAAAETRLEVGAWAPVRAEATQWAGA